MATECSRNDGSKTQYYVVILDWLQGHSGALEWALESWIRGPLTVLLSKSGELISTKSSISIHVSCFYRSLLLLFVSCSVMSSILFKDNCDY